MASMSCDNDLIVGYLYDELSAPERERFARHLEGCGTCRDEVGGLRQTRTTVSAWTVPSADLGFEMVRRPSVLLGRRPARFAWSPAWGLAAAAVLVLATAAAIANVQIRTTAEGLVVSTGWSRPAASSPVAQPAGSAASMEEKAPPMSSAESAAVLARLREIEAALAARPASPAPAAGTSNVKQADLLRIVRQLIDESEKRQEGQLAVLIAQVHRDVDAARRADFARIQAGMSQIQGVNDAQVMWQRQMEDRILRVVQQQR